jgi:hypothetical protein
MSALSKETKINIVKTLVPAVKRLQEAHKALDLEIDPTFGDGLLGFDDSCQAYERAARKERAEFVRMYEDLSVRFSSLYGAICAEANQSSANVPMLSHA